MRGSTGARLALLAAIWGSSFLWIKLALRGLSPLEVTFGRLILGAAASYGVSFVYMDKFLARRGISPVALSGCQLLTASGFLAVALGAAGAPGPRLDATVAVSIAILGLLGTGIAYVLNYQIITSAGATSASTVTYLLPVVAIILGVAVLGEHVSVLTLAGIALILAGVALTRRRGVAAGQGQPRAAGRAGPAG